VKRRLGLAVLGVLVTIGYVLTSEVLACCNESAL
jgi:hypothetical protein